MYCTVAEEERTANAAATSKLQNFSTSPFSGSASAPSPPLLMMYTSMARHLD